MKKYCASIVLGLMLMGTTVPAQAFTFSDFLNPAAVAPSFSLASLANVLQSLQNALSQLVSSLQRMRVDGNTPGQSSQLEVSLEKTTLRLLALRREYAAGKRQDTLNQMTAEAQARKQAILATLESNPESVLRVVIPESTRQSFPPQIQALIEAEVTIEGTLTVLHIDDFENEKGKFMRTLKTPSGDIALYYVGDEPSDTTGARLKVNGYKLDNTLLAAPGGGGGKGKPTPPPPAPTLAPVIGAQRTLVIAVNFQDAPTNQPFTVDQIRGAVFGTISDFFRENSYNQAWLEGDVAGWYTIPMNSSPWNYSQISTLADSAATAAGYNLANYTHILYITDGAGGYGVSSVGGNPSRSWTRGDITLKIAGHELGHALGLFHSHSLECGTETLANTIGPNIYPAPPPPGSCYSIEYGDVADIMGSGLYVVHVNAYQKERLGWLNYNVSPPLTNVVTSGIYSITPTSVNDLQPKGLKILKGIDSLNGSNQYYYAEYRQLIGFDTDLNHWFTFGDVNKLTHGPLIHLGTPGFGNTSYLLDMTASSTIYSQDTHDVSLVVGQTFTDPDSGVSMTTLATTTSNATVSVTLGTPTCVRRNPTVSLTPSNQIAGSGQSLTYLITVTNRDNSVCGSSTFTITPVLPAGWVQSPSSLSLTLAAGTASAAQSILVTSPQSSTGGMYSITETVQNVSALAYSGSASVTFTIDNAVADFTPPTTIITAPANGSTVAKRSLVTITANATDNVDVTRVEFYVNNTLTCTIYATPYNCYWQSPRQAGTAQFQTKAYDAVGNIGGSSVVSVTVQ